MSLYRQTATGFVCEFASSPGSGYTLISSQPTDTIANRVTWWRNLDKGTLTSTWHPSELAGPEVPGRDTNAGSGINLMPNDYASFEWAGSMPPNYTSGMTVNRTAAATYHGQYGVRLTTTSAGGTVWLAASGSVFNIALSPSSKWIVSAYVRPLTNAAVSGTLKLKTQGGTTHSVSFTSGALSSTWVRVSGVFDLSADTSDFGQLGISLTNNSTSLDIDALMLEEKIGPYDTASVWYSPWGNGLSDGEIGPGTVTQDKLFGELSSTIDLVRPDNFLPNSVNARLASQYDTLVQQISEVSVGNGQFDSKIIWYFDQSSEITGWTGTSASLAVSGGYLTVTGTGTSPKFKTATIAVDGSAYQLVRLRVKRVGGSGWNGTLRYYYAGGSNTISISEPAQIGSEYVEASWDMAGVALWTGNTITAVEIQLGTASGDNYSIDWMGVGRNAPGASYSQVEAVRVLSDNKTRVFYQTTAPASDSNYTLKANDLWFDTDDGNKPYRWSGSAWVETTDTRLADSWAEIVDIRNATANPSGTAAQRINSISATASSKNRTFYQASTSAPSSPTTGDLWFQTDQGNKAFRWNGSAWEETTDTRLPSAVSSITTIETAKIGYCTIGGNTSTHGEKSTCEAAGGTWNVGLPWATAVKQVSITAANGTSATVQQQFEAIYGAGGLRAQYSVKLAVDAGGNQYVVGFGLYNEGPGASGFIVRADKFVVGSAGSNVIPFEVVGSTTYIKAAMIQDASITSAKIGTLNAEKITGGYLDMARINTGAITAAKIDSRGLSIKDASGNVIFSAGTTVPSNLLPAASSNLIPNFRRWTIPSPLSVWYDAPWPENRAFLTIPNGSNYVGASSPAMALASGWQYCLSFEAFLSNGTSRVLHADLYPDDLPESTFTITPTRTKFSVVWTSTSASLANCTLRFFAEAQAGDIGLFNVKLEAGSTPTAWSESIADRVGVDNPLTTSNITTYISGAAIGTAQIANAAITNAKIADATIEGAKIKNATITDANIANATITDAKISGTLSADRIAANSITTAKLAFTPVQSGGAAADINAFTTTIDGSKITTDSLYANTIKAGTITADRIEWGGIDTDRIGSNAVTYSYGATTGASFGSVSNANTGYFTMASHIIPAVAAGRRGRLQILASLNTWDSTNGAPQTLLSIVKQSYNSSGIPLSQSTLMTDIDNRGTLPYGRVFCLAVDESFDTNQIGILFRVQYITANNPSTLYARGSFTVLEFKR